MSDSEEHTSDYDEDGDSDAELQVAFSQGLLKPGLNVAIQEETRHIYNKGGLEQCITDMKKDLAWIERLDLAVDPIKPPRPMLGQLGDDPDDLSGEAVHDDFKREMKFHRMAQAAVLEGLPKLHQLHVPTRRPDDYFAQMAKSDDHMKRVKEKLLAKQLSMERSEKAKKLRELRKFGKKVQHEVLQKRQKEKKEMLNAVKKYRKGKTDRLDFLKDDSSAKGTRGGSTKKQDAKDTPGKKREYKNAKFGYGGQKKRGKQNTAESTDQGVFNWKKNNKRLGQPPSKKMNKNKNKRPGKRRRQNMKSRK